MKPESSSYIHGAYFCVNVECLEKGFITDASKPGKYVQYKQFEGKIWIPKSVQDEVASRKLQIPELEGVEWVFE